MPKKDLDQIKEVLREDLKKRPEIVFAILYGSVLDGDDFQDIDVALWVDRAHLSEAEELKYSFDHADHLSQLLAFPVDVRVINQAPLGFRYNVSRGEPLLIDAGEVFYTFLERTWDEYFDFEPVARRYLEEMV